MTTKSEREAQRLLRSHGVEIAPTPVEELAEAEGAQIRFRTFDGDISGLLLQKPGTQPIIGVHAAHPRVRQRFTVAHELGHLILEHDGRPMIVEHLHRSRVSWRDGTSSLATDREEIAANQFAAALLMPRTLVEEMFDDLIFRHHTTDAAIDLLARRFEVSAQAMRFRLVNLALIDPV